MNHMRVHLVHGRLPHEARDADAVSATPNDDRKGTLVVASDGALFFASSLLVLQALREALWAHDLSIRGNASSNYRTPAVHRAGPPPRTDLNSDCWY